MELHNLKPAEGSVKKGKRIARGQGSGHGGTATRGHKGAKSRSGYSRKRGHEGGQMPLQMRVPKRGFKNPNRVEYVAFSLARLQEMADVLKTDTIDVNTLIAQGVIRKNDLVKILGDGELKSRINVSVHACSASAKQAVETAGGSVNLV
ncbi:MAG: 50S ribosomal protein L15 [Saprospiraceae bacterium]|nr:50S ribosomal protein L15 [Saprospiraceae bacterium]MCB9323801.1 50S ribosomal protein L15 [Lewinellaceae bacterium]